MKSINALVAVLALASFAAHAQVSITEDRFTGDKSARYLADDVVLDAAMTVQRPVTITAYKSRPNGSRAFSGLVITVKSPRHLFLRCKSFNWLFDGKRTTIKAPDKSSSIIRGAVLENFSFSIGDREIKLFSDASKVEMSICGHEFSIDPAGIAGMNSAWSAKL